MSKVELLQEQAEAYVLIALLVAMTEEAFIAFRSFNAT